MNHRRALALLPALGLAITLALQPATAHAFCGFYVSGADAHLYNSATQVVLMRDGNRTVLSMANDYQGPPQDFAMVVPVPVVLQESDVKVLPASIFERVDALAAPRLVEYWEQDPCYMDQVPEAAMDDMSMPEPMMEKASGPVARDLGVTIEAQFTVGEYEIVILSAQDSLGLDTWLRRNRYNIPKGAQYALRPYVHQGMKFFVAKVDVDKVARDPSGRATLSPLRFHYDTPTFSLPVRLGLLNSAGAQDLIIHILSREVRYQVANYKNVTIPTNLEVRDQVRHEFGRFYAALFDRVLLKNPRSVVTEYSWSAASCDPCPVEPLNLDELATLGADVLPSFERSFEGRVPTDAAYSIPSQFVLTRLHTRYNARTLGEDLVFQAAVPIAGGRESFGPDGQTLERGAQPSDYGNNFQARYIIRHRWQGPVECAEPRYGVWGGPPPGVEAASTGPAVARDVAFVDRTAPLEPFLAEQEQGAHAGLLRKDTVPPPDPQPFQSRAGCRVDDTGPRGLGLLGLLGLAALRRRRAARRPR